MLKVLLFIFTVKLKLKIVDSPWRDLRAGLFYTHAPLPPTFMFVVDGLVGPAEPGELCFLTA